MNKLFVIVWFACWSPCYGQESTSDIRGPFKFKSAIYPGTERNYWAFRSRTNWGGSILSSLSQKTEQPMSNLAEMNLTYYTPVVTGKFSKEKLKQLAFFHGFHL